MDNWPPLRTASLQLLALFPDDTFGQAEDEIQRHEPVSVGWAIDINLMTSKARGFRGKITGVNILNICIYLESCLFGNRGMSLPSREKGRGSSRVSKPAKGSSSYK